MERLVLVGGEREVALDHHALADRRVAARSRARPRPRPRGRGRPSRASAPRSGARAAGRWSTRTGAPGASGPAETTGRAVVGEAGGARVGELAHLGQLLAALALRDRGEEADRDLGLAPRGLDQRAERRRRSRPPGRCSASRGSRRSRRPRPRPVPEAIVSSSSRPGVRRCTCGSTNAGASTSPRAVDDAVAVRVERSRRAARSRRRRRGRRAPRRCPRRGRARARRGRRGPRRAPSLP